MIVANRVSLTLMSEPPGMTIRYDGVEHTTPFTATPIVGSTHTIDAQDSGSGWRFDHWSDNGVQQHSVTVPTNDMSLVATYRIVSWIPLVVR